MMQSVQVIIERLKSHPEDFFGDLEDSRLRHTAPKFHRITDKIDDLLTEPQDGRIHRLWYLEPEEKEALIEAYKEARRARFEAQVFHTLLTNAEPEETNTVTYRTVDRYHPNTGKPLMAGPSSIVASQKIINDSLELLNRQFDTEYAKNSNP